MKTRKLLGLIAMATQILWICAIATAIIGCKPEPEPTTPAHVHQFGTEWKKDATQHWHECSCGEKADIANHTWGNWIVKTPATPTADGEETRTCSICGEKETCPIEQTEPTKKDFPVSFDFKNPENPDYRYNAIVTDKRTACGSKNLEQLEVNDKSIITIIEDAFNGAFNTATTPQKNRFRNVFDVEGGVTMYVENTTTVYKIKAPDNKTIYFHIDFLKGSTADIQQKVFDAVTAMNTGGSSLPYNAVWFDTPRTLTFPTTENPNNTYSVTITSEEQFTADEWKTHCDNVVTALETAYGTAGALNKGKFRTVFNRDCGVEIILEKNPTGYTNYKIGVVGDDFKELYLNVDNIASINYANAISAMNGKNSSDPLMKD